MEQKKIDQLMERIKNDKRSANEVFMSIADKLVKEHNIPKEKSLEAARNLIGVFEVAMKVAEHQNDED